MKRVATILQPEKRRIVYLTLCCMMLAWVPPTLLSDSPPAAATPTPAARRTRRPGARDLNWRPEYVEGAGVIAAHIANTFEQLTDCSDHNSRTAPATFMQEYAGDLARVCVPAARLAHCQPVPGAARYELAGRVGTNAVQIGVSFGCNRIGLIKTLTFDRPLVLPGGATCAAGMALPIETVMRALAVMRRGESFGTEDLVITRATTKVAYANQDATKAKFSYMVRGSAPTAYTSFSSTDLTQFVITPEPLFDTNVVAHAFYRLSTGVISGKQPKYLHYFITLDAAHRQHKNGYFLATLHGGMVDFIYKMAMDNGPGDLMAGAQYAALRTFTTTNPPLRGLGFGRFIFGIGTETHTVSNVPLFGRITKASSSVTRAK